MIKHLLVTSLESGRLAAAATSQSSIARKLGGEQNESRKDQQRDKSKAAQQHAPVPALTR
jgi:hypothetical protein